MKSTIAATVLAFLFLFTHLAGFGQPYPEGSQGRNAAAHIDKPYLVLVSLDGFGWDYPERFQTPAIDQIIAGGFRAERLVPVFPTLTFPNHYSIATGLYPDRHGLVANYFYMPEFQTWYELSDREKVGNGRYYNGEPVWVTAEKQGMVTAAYFFVGTEAAIQGVRPVYWKNYSNAVPGAQRVDQVLNWLQMTPEARPHFITLYFEEVDDHSHWSGVKSTPAREAVARVDAYLGRLMAGISMLPHADQVNVVVVSDHGQAPYVEHPDTLVLNEHLDLSGIRIIGKGPYSFLYYQDKAVSRITMDRDRLRSAWQGGRVLTPDEAPDAWRIQSSGRWPDLMVIADPGQIVVTEFDQIAQLNPGTHGWAPEFSDMHGILFGKGPAFRTGARLGPVRVVDLQPLIMNVLEIEGPMDVDGDPAALLPALERR